MTMKCPSCEFDNPETAHFCADCGTQLGLDADGGPSYTRTLIAPIEELTTGSTFAGRYQIIEELGRGGMGRIYKVFDTEINEKIALKLIKPDVAADKDTIERFRNEMKFARQVGHRNVARMFDLGKHEGTYYITMEYVPGEDLKSFIRRIGQLPLSKAVSIAKQITDGLIEAHRQGVIHRDLKPRNIIIDREGNAKILDFGIARSLKSKGVTEKGVMVGTPEYMSPEQTETRDIDQRSDIYSLGIILFEMLTGRIPFEGETPLSVAIKQKNEKPPRPEEFNPGIPENLSRLILKCLEKDPINRFSSAEELLYELESAEKELPTSELTAPRRKPSTTKELTVTLNVKKVALPIVSVILLVCAVFLIRQLFFRPSPLPVMGDKPSLAVMYFKNNTGSQELEHWRTALSDLLITDLSQSKFLRMLSAESLFAILDDMGQLEAPTYSTNILKDVAEKGRVAHVLVGNYTEAGDKFRINVSLQEARSGELIASESVEGLGESSFYAMVDEITRWVKSNLELSQQSLAEDLDSEVETITTSSPEAYKLYSEGRRLHLQADYLLSIVKMQEAIVIDPDFAMAYRSLAVSYGNMGRQPARNNAVKRAYELSDRVSERERLAIQGDYYMSSRQTYDKAIEAYQRLLSLYPEDRIGRINLGIIYFSLEEFEKAILLYEAHIQNEPEGLLGYWNLAETLQAKGEYNRAHDTLMRYLQVNPGYLGVEEKILTNYMFLGEYDKARDQIWRILTLDTNWQAAADSYSGQIHILQGNYQEAQSLFAKLPPAGRTRKLNMSYSYLYQGKFKAAVDLMESAPVYYYDLADICLKAGESEKALVQYAKELRDAKSAQDIWWQIHTIFHEGLAYLQMKKFDDVLAKTDEIRKLLDGGMNSNLERYHQHLQGMLQMEKGELSAALPNIEKSAGTLFSPENNFPPIHSMAWSSLGQAYFRTGNWEKAAQWFEKVLSLTYGRISEGDYYARAIYWLGKCYQAQSQPQKAAENYRTFLELWKDADPGRSEIKDARSQLALLQ
jgi:serine/threonine protein kinase/tetratricopeptide (TPR) repeat protein